jgi:hypothetical protein
MNPESYYNLILCGSYMWNIIEREIDPALISYSIQVKVNLLVILLLPDFKILQFKSEDKCQYKQYKAVSNTVSVCAETCCYIYHHDKHIKVHIYRNFISPFMT